jgi:hemolysin III
VAKSSSDSSATGNDDRVDNRLTEAFDREDHIGAWDDPLLLSGLFGAFNNSSDDDTDRHRKHTPWFRRLKEPFCGWSHLAGAALSVAALLCLLLAARGRPFHLISLGIYGVSLVVLFTASALYHSLRGGPQFVRRLQRLDHMAIFLLIAGTYAPICLVSLHGPWGWSLLAIEYILAFTGIALIVTLRRRFPAWLRIGLCAGMTWLIAILPLCLVMPPTGIAWLLAGLLTYTIGTLILATDWPHLWPGKFSAHDLWHLFVLGGSACHFILMLVYVAPVRIG